jgi:hypothetical protein
VLREKTNASTTVTLENIDILNTWNAGGNTDLPPIAQASRSKDCSYKAGGESVSAELELAEGYNLNHVVNPRANATKQFIIF